MSQSKFIAYPTQHPMCLIFASLKIMPRVYIALHLPVAHDNITGQLANDNYKFSACPYSASQEFIVEIEVMITSHPEIVRKNHVRHMDSFKVLKIFAFITDELNIP